MPHGIEHQPAPGEARLIADGQHRHIHRALPGIGRQQLVQRGHAVEQAGVVARRHADALRGDIQRIAAGFAHRRLRIALQHDGRRRLAVGGELQTQAPRAGQQFDQVIRTLTHGGGVAGKHDRCVGVHGEMAGLQLELGRQRNQRNRRIRGCGLGWRRCSPAPRLCRPTGSGDGSSAVSSSEVVWHKHAAAKKNGPEKHNSGPDWGVCQAVRGPGVERIRA